MKDASKSFIMINRKYFKNFWKRKICLIHPRYPGYLQTLATQMFKVTKGLASDIFSSVFNTRKQTKVQLRHVSHFNTYTEFFLVRIFLYCDEKKLSIWKLFTQW